MHTPWAILLCKFKNSTPEQFGPPGTQRMQELFASVGSGKLNMVDFFRDMSHGNLDLSGSQVFGWYTLDKYSTEYVGNGTNTPGRLQLLQWARQAAIADNKDLSTFYSIVVITSPPTDLFGGPGGAVSGDGRKKIIGTSSLSPSLLGQEMGHVYGLQHSRSYSTGADSTDSWDVMSTLTMFSGAHPYFTELDQRGFPIFRLGPGLNAANMWSRSWLDTSRVWTAARNQHNTIVQLRPLHRRDLPGYLVARVGSYFVEFRMPELWDLGIGSPVVLVHEFISGSSYLHNAPSGKQGLEPGDSFQQGDPSDPFGAFLEVRVVGIDPTARTATIRVTWRARRLLRSNARIQVGVTSDAGGLIIVGGKIIKVPPHSPLFPMVEALALALDSESISNGVARDLIQRDALQSISDVATAQLHRTLAYREPAPPTPGPQEQSDCKT